MTTAPAPTVDLPAAATVRARVVDASAPATNLQKVIAWLPRIVIALALLAFLGYLLVYILYAVQLFNFPYDYDQGEGFELNDTILFSRGELPYKNVDEYPFYSSNYPPLFHLMTVPLVWLFGPEYWTGRLLSFMATLATAAAIGLAVHREGRRGWLAILSGLAFLASNYVYHVGPLFRQHMTMVMFETLAIVLLAVTIDKEERTNRRDNWALLGVMALLLAAGYTKQLAYATVIAAFIFLFLRGPLRAILWAVPFALVAGLIFLGLDAATGGQWLLNTITANLNPFVPGQALALYRQWFSLHWVITTAALLYAIYQLYWGRLSVYAIWFVVAVINAVTAGKWGAGESYFTTAIAASCILSGLAFSHLVTWTKERRYVPVDNAFWIGTVVVPSLIGLLYLVQADRVFHMPTHTPGLKAVAAVLGKPTETPVAPQTSCSGDRPAQAAPYVDSAGVSLLGMPPDASDTAAGDVISNLILQAGPSPAFSEEAGFNIRLGRDVVTNPTQLLNLYNNNAVDLTNMLGMLDRQEFDSIVLRAQFYPPPVLDMIGQRYETTDLVEMNNFVYCVLRPK